MATGVAVARSPPPVFDVTARWTPLSVANQATATSVPLTPMSGSPRNPSPVPDFDVVVAIDEVDQWCPWSALVASLIAPESAWVQTANSRPPPIATLG